MLYVQAVNITGGNGTAADGTAQYDCRVAINERLLWGGSVSYHVRAEGAAALLRRIADAMDAHPRSQPAGGKSPKRRVGAKTPKHVTTALPKECPGCGAQPGMELCHCKPGCTCARCAGRKKAK